MLRHFRLLLVIVFVLTPGFAGERLGAEFLRRPSCSATA